MKIIKGNKYRVTGINLSYHGFSKGTIVKVVDAGMRSHTVEGPHKINKNDTITQSLDSNQLERYSNKVLNIKKGILK